MGHAQLILPEADLIDEDDFYIGNGAKVFQEIKRGFIGQFYAEPRSSGFISDESFQRIQPIVCIPESLHQNGFSIQTLGEYPGIVIVTVNPKISLLRH